MRLAAVMLAVGCGSPTVEKSKTSTNSGSNNVAVNSTTTPTNVMTTDPSKVDVLWVVDNSGSMCQEQETLIDNFELFAERVSEQAIDFHIGVTTTDMNPDYVLEPISKPGLLQATPQPVPGFDRSCHTAVDGAGQPIRDDYSPIRTAIGVAVDCMESPDESFKSASNADIDCGLYATPQGCTIARAGCGGGTACAPEDLFPDPSTYRSIPKVLRAEDYGGAGSIDVARLKADFACIAMVGTRGYGIEKGLGAAVEAVSLAKTGGAVGAAGADTSAPNHGLLRADATFGLVFVTDENDCTHDGSLAEDSACGGNVCEFANIEGEDSALIAPDELSQQLMDNLRSSKGDPALSTADVYVASLHANSKRFTGPVVTEAQCGGPDYEGIAPSCATALGAGFSGDRYESFLRTFPDDHIFPQPNPSNPDASLTGWMCTGDFRPALEAIGELFAGQQ